MKNGIKKIIAAFLAFLACFVLYSFCCTSSAFAYADLVVTAAWLDDDDVYFTLKNIGDAPALTQTQADLWIDGVQTMRTSTWSPNPLAVGESWQGVFTDDWGCRGNPGESSPIRIRADYNNRVGEWDPGGEDNNSLTMSSPFRNVRFSAK